MRPLQVTISAWGSYKEKVTVDFTKFNKGSLFLITGPTGAGKTTIFDAISFALFGDVSGKTREKVSLRSDFATVDEKTYVELTFEHRNRNYRVFRAPKYERPKKRGEGTTTSLEVAELYIEKEAPIVIMNEVNKRIEQILGLSYSQYKQISMIAQGEFLELLVANSKDRVEILRNIFKTNSFERFQKELSDRANTLYKSLTEMNNRLEEVTATIEIEDETVENELLVIPYNYDRITEELKKMLLQSSHQIKEYQSKIERIEENEKEWIEKIAKERKRQEEVIRLEQIEKEIAQLLNDKERIEEKKLKLQKSVFAKNVEQYDKVYSASVEQYLLAKKKWEQINEELMQNEPILSKKKEEFEKIKDLEARGLQLQNEKQRLELYLPVIAELKRLKERINQESLLREQKEKDLENLKKTIALCDERIQKEQEKYARYESVEISIENNKLQYQQNKSALEKVQEILQLDQRYKQEEKTKEGCIVTLDLAEKEYLQDKNQYEEIEIRYKRAMIGIVARDLVEGSPCPVCGSLVHPKKAEVTEEILDEKHLEQQKKKLEVSQKKYQEAYSVVAVIQEKIANIKSDLETKCSAISCDSKDVSERFKDLGRKQKEIEQCRVQLEETLQLKYKTQEELEALKEKQEKNKEQYLVREKEISLLIQSIEDKNKQYISRQKEFPSQYKDSNQIESVLRSLKEEIVRNQDNMIHIRAEYEKVHTVKERLLALKVEREDEMRRVHDRSIKEKEELKRALVQNGFESLEDFRSSCVDEQQKRLLEETIREYDKNCQEKLLQQKTIKETLTQETAYDMQLLLEKQQEMASIKKNLQGKLQEYITTRTVNERAYQLLKEKLKKKVELESTYGVVKKLDNLAKGNNKERLVFEQYVLASYFEEILRAANLRLREMSNNRYELLRSKTVNDARKKDSLDIEVLDNYTGKKRSVKSLSGGESFKAALCLALGMADIVQNYAGGIEIDTLFIDEGFGSLDVESLEQALDTLASLTEKDRLIGIISHVNELKERINNQIVVERGKQGSTLTIKTI